MKDDLESVLFLLSIQVDVNSRVHDVNQTPPLHLAAASKNEMLVRNLILAGARINDKDSTSKTALHIACGLLFIPYKYLVFTGTKQLMCLYLFRTWKFTSSIGLATKWCRF